MNKLQVGGIPADHWESPAILFLRLGCFRSDAHSEEWDAVVVDMGVAVAMTVAVAVTEAMGQFLEAYTSHATVATQSRHSRDTVATQSRHTRDW